MRPIWLGYRGAFDLVISIFGAMFAPKPFEVAKEMVRVTRPGERIRGKLDSQIRPWSRSENKRRLFTATRKASSPMTWDQTNVTERFASAGVPRDSVSSVRDISSTSRAPSEFVDAFRRYYGPTMNAFEGGGQNRPRRRSEEGAGGVVRKPEHQPAQRCHFHPGNVLTRDCCGELGGHRFPAKLVGSLA